jgi:hypothetical protein
MEDAWPKGRIKVSCMRSEQMFCVAEGSSDSTTRI